jgi:hypothetical protein
MGGRAKSQAQKTLEYRTLYDEAVEEAVTLYQSELAKPAGKKRKGLRRCAEEIMAQYTRANKRVKFCHQTIIDRHNGKDSLTVSRRRQRKFKWDILLVIVDYTLSLSRWGWPLSRRRVQQHGNLLLREMGHEPNLGRHWVDRFVQAFPQLRTYKPKPHDTIRGQAANPANVAGWYKLLGDVLLARIDFEEYPDLESIDPECIYACDESGFQPCGSTSGEKVIGRAGQKLQYQQNGGSRETITVLATICADGTALPPAVIFKGEHFLVKWSQENPLQCSYVHNHTYIITTNFYDRLGVAKKGFVNGEITGRWAIHFDEQTRAKAAGRYRVLLVDGHVSHFSMDFLQECRNRHIIVLCYPSHLTHILQGLDVVVFSPLKRAWERSRNDYEARTGLPVKKTTFLKLLAEAWIAIMIPEIIMKAFEKTGVVPYNPNVITLDKLATSISTSTHSNGIMPFEPPDAVKAMSQALRHLWSVDEPAWQDDDEDAPDSNLDADRVFDIDELLAEAPAPTTPATPPPAAAIQAAIEARDALLSTPVARLVDGSPMDSSFILPTLQAVPPETPHRPRRPPQDPSSSPGTSLSVYERLARAEAEIRELRAKNSELQDATSELRKQTRTCMAQMVMQTSYVELTRQQLHGKEKSEREKAAGNKRLTTTHASLITSNEWIEAAQSHNTKQISEAEQKKEKEVKMKVWHDEMEAWKRADRARIELNARRRKATKSALEKWQKSGRQGRKPAAAQVERAQPKPENPYPRKSKKSKEVAMEHSEEEEEDEDRVESEDEESEGGDDGDE